MITGDYGLTAESLARRVGMLQTPSPRILTGADVDSLNEFELQKILQEEVIFARMAPEHKLRLVAAMQASGEFAAAPPDTVSAGGRSRSRARQPTSTAISAAPSAGNSRIPPVCSVIS